jgi:Domain of Unknown Function (DUF1206)
MAADDRGQAEQAGDSASLEALARVGLVAYGLVHLLIGWLALQIAWSASDSRSADTSGALRTLADQPFGKVLLWLVGDCCIKRPLSGVTERSSVRLPQRHPSSAHSAAPRLEPG